MKKIRVLIVEDSHVVREFLQHLIGQDARLEVAAAVTSGEEALEVLDKVAPDVISMDIRLPGMNGFEATRQIMSRRPTPIVVVSASVEAEDLQISMNALRVGALAVVEKPVGMTHKGYEALASRLCTQLVLMSQVKVVRQRLARTQVPGSAAPSRPPTSAKRDGTFSMVGIVASTGGPAALQQVLGGLDSRFPLPILLVQHIAAGFLEGFAAWLRTVCPLSVVVAADGQLPAAGTVYLAPADKHLAMRQTRLSCDTGDLVSQQRPSGTILFRSLAASLGPRSICVLLTGMGDDGAAGLKELRDAGGYTIAEDESTAVVYGMPAVAVRLGGVCESLPVTEIGPRLAQLAPTLKEAR
jgi:two-component system chemotaxis response regulator CheB